MQSPITIAFGLPIPSTDPLFLTIVGVHVLFGLVAVTSGALAMMSRKGRGRHANSGTIYFWSISGVFATMSVLSLMRWAENWHLLIVGAIAFASAWFGRAAARRRLGRWPQVHLLGMAGSYIGLLRGQWQKSAVVAGASESRVLAAAERGRRAGWPSMSSGGAP